MPHFSTVAQVLGYYLQRGVEGIEKHKDFFALSIQFLAVVATICGGVFVWQKYYRDKREAREKALLDLKREAYADLFTAIPLHLASLADFFRDSNAQMVKIPPEGYRAYHRVLLLASHDALQCIVDRNAIFHKGVNDLQNTRSEFRQFELIVNGGDSRFAERLVLIGERFRQRYVKLVTDLSTNYRDLLALARREMEFKGDMALILDTLRKDEEEALAIWRS